MSRTRKLEYPMSNKPSLAGFVLVLCGLFLGGMTPGCTSDSVGPPVIQGGEGGVEMASLELEASGMPPQIRSLQLVPTRPQPNELVKALVKVARPDDGALDLDFEWSIADRPVRARSEAVRFPAARKGDRIEVRVTATDSQGRASVATAFARIGNQAPSLLGVDLARGAGTAFEASVRTHDADGDDLRLMYEWRVNGRRVSGRLPVLDTRELRRGDEVQVVVIADDGDDHSDPVMSQVVQVENSAPEITSVPRNESPNGSFFYQVQAEDPDLDRGLIYSLVESPRGMAIGRLGGELTWNPGPDQGGVHTITIQVEDRHGGSALQTFELTIHDGPSSQELASARN